jgi:hypothetical protein
MKKGTKAQRHKGTKAQRHMGTKAQRHMGLGLRGSEFQMTIIYEYCNI